LRYGGRKLIFSLWLLGVWYEESGGSGEKEQPIKNQLLLCRHLSWWWGLDIGYSHDFTLSSLGQLPIYWWGTRNSLRVQLFSRDQPKGEEELPPCLASFKYLIS